MTERMTQIAVIGAWHNAFITAACLASIGHDVMLVNPDAPAWTSFPALGIHEPGLDELLAKAREKSALSWANLTDDLDGAASVVWLAMDTPLRDDDSPDVEPLLVALSKVRGRFPGISMLIVGSQVPVGFCRRVERELELPVAYVPENMRLGSGVKDFLHPDRYAIGATKEETRKIVAELLRVGRDGVGYQPSVVFCDLPTAEMIKHGTNAMLATQISLANELARVGEMYGADTQLVAKAMKMDRRIGSHAYVRPGLGFSGGTLPRDLRALQMAASPKPGLIVSTPLVDAVLDVNESVVDHVAETVAQMGCRLARILGYTYKAETDALRCSPLYPLARALEERSIVVTSHDPRAFHGAVENIRWHRDEWVRRADVHIIVTALPAFRTADWSGLACGTQPLPSRAVVYDLCDGADKKAVLAAGLSYKAIRQPTEDA